MAFIFHYIWDVILPIDELTPSFFKMGTASTTKQLRFFTGQKLQLRTMKPFDPTAFLGMDSGNSWLVSYLICSIWVCLKMEYTPNYSHLVGIMIINHWVIGYTIFRQTHITN